MALAQTSPAFILEETFEDFISPAFGLIGPVLSKRVFPIAFPSLLPQNDLWVEMDDGVTI